MGKVLKAVKRIFSPDVPKPAKLPTPEKAVPLPMIDDVSSRQAALKSRAEAAARGGRDSTMLTEQRLGDQGSPMTRSGMAGSSVVTG